MKTFIAEIHYYHFYDDSCDSDAVYRVEAKDFEDAHDATIKAIDEYNAKTDRPIPLEACLFLLREVCDVQDIGGGIDVEQDN